MFSNWLGERRERFRIILLLLVLLGLWEPFRWQVQLHWNVTPYIWYSVTPLSLPRFPEPPLISKDQPSNISGEKSLALIFGYTWKAEDHCKIAFFSRKGFKAEKLFILTTKTCILSYIFFPSKIDAYLNTSFLIYLKTWILIFPTEL